MSLIETAKDIYSVASGTSDYIAISTRKFCVHPVQEVSEYCRAVGDIAGGMGTVIEILGDVVDGAASLYQGAEPNWATGSVTRMTSFGIYMV
ncbi:hypothetical protein [Agrobacterium tumefaciens]|uniref:hypothetical protein n=1 Tax=Agrobacterium tumefaciens TaxID=358 RepID=UPI00285B664F|nr:hypothetical protein [Agrobacterium tumefaciens]MDR6587413.1 hypothetical protein [Agrobacterium tumefaciens]